LYAARIAGTTGLTLNWLFRFGLLAFLSQDGWVFLGLFSGRFGFSPFDNLEVLDHVDLEDDTLDFAVAGRHVRLAFRLAAFGAEGLYVGEMHGALSFVNHHEGALVADFRIGDQ
jgi:hypothetical protein